MTDPPTTATAAEGSSVDPRWSLANERTFLAWTRTALALLAGGVVAAKLADFEHELVRWVVAGPPLIAGAMLSAGAARRWRTYEDAMRKGDPLPVGRGLAPLAYGLAGYGVVVLLVLIVDG